MKKTSPSTLTTFHELSDWQKFHAENHSDEEIKRILRQRQFYQIPKHNDQMARQHSMLVDKILGFDLKSVEEKLVKKGQAKMPNGSFEYWGPALHDGAQTWVGLDAQTLNTPYSVLWRLCELVELKANMSVVDLGAAHGRLGLVMHSFEPNATFIGLEYVPERVELSQKIYQRWGCLNASAKVADLFAKDFEMPEVDIYFIYDYGRHDHINATLGQISLEAAKRPIKLIARGQATNKLIADHHAWATLIYEGVDEEHFNIYEAQPETI
jgi:hypothetical protein